MKLSLARCGIVKNRIVPKNNRNLLFFPILIASNTVTGLLRVFTSDTLIAVRKAITIINMKGIRIVLIPKKEKNW
ncbi:hypothetical protein R0K17_28120, partial [Planococcus sp. SIMBA_143]